MRALPAIFAILIVIASGTAALGQDVGNIRVTNLSPDTGEVSIWIDGEVAREYLGFKRTTEYIAVAPGTHTIEVRDALGGTDTLLSHSLSIVASENYTLGLTGVLSQNDLQFITLLDDDTTDIRSARVRFVHTTPGMPAIDIAIPGGRVLVENLSFRGQSDYIPVRPDVYPLEIRVAGTSEVLYTIPEIGMSRLTACTIFTVTLGEDNVLQTVHTFEANRSINYQEILIGLSLWAALLAWFVQNHAN